MRTYTGLTAIAAIALLAGGCTQESTAEDETTDETATDEADGGDEAVAVDDTEATEDNDVGEETKDKAEKLGENLRLGSDGLETGSVGLHSSGFLKFGTPREKIVAEVTKLRGKPTETSRNEECGAGPIDFTYFGPLALHFQDDKFVGWSMADKAGDPPIESDMGVKIGATRADFDEGFFDVEESSLGTEFDAGSIYGIFASDKPNAKIEHLWAGTSCNFR